MKIKLLLFFAFTGFGQIAFSQSVVYKFDFNSPVNDKKPNTGTLTQWVNKPNLLPMSIRPYGGIKLEIDGVDPYPNNNTSTDTCLTDNSCGKLTSFPEQPRTIPPTTDMKYAGFELVLQDLDKIQEFSTLKIDMATNGVSPNCIRIRWRYAKETIWSTGSWSATIKDDCGDPFCWKTQYNDKTTAEFNISELNQTLNASKDSVVFQFFFAGQGCNFGNQNQYKASNSSATYDPASAVMLIDNIRVYAIRNHVGIDDINSPSDFLTFHNGNLYSSKNGTYAIIDLTGRQVADGRIISDQAAPLTLNRNQIYVVRFMDATGNQYAKRIWIE